MALSPKTVLRALRPKQWTKNALVFAAFIFALGDAEQGIGLAHFWVVVQAATLFCVISSGIYLLNDVLDYEFDRAHPVKRHRPIASGELPRPTARILALLLTVAGLAAATFLPAQPSPMVPTGEMMSLFRWTGLSAAKPWPETGGAC